MGGGVRHAEDKRGTPLASLLEDLDPAQRDAVATTEGPLLLIAGPGAGKTLTLVRRTLHLLTSGLAEPERVKGDETTSYADWMSASRLGSLIQATSGSFGGVGGWWRNRPGFAL